MAGGCQLRTIRRTVVRRNVNYIYKPLILETYFNLPRLKSISSQYSVRILTTDMCCEIIIIIVALVATARRNHARKKREAAQDILSTDAASGTTTLAPGSPGSTKDGDTTQGLSEKIFKNAALDAKTKSRRSFGDRWREFMG